MTEALNVLALVTEAFGGYGGIAQYDRDFLYALSLAQKVGRIVVLPRLSRTPPAVLPKKIEQQSSPSGKLSYVPAAMGIAHRDGPFNVIFCGHINLAPLAALLARLYRIPLWLQIHGVDAWYRPPYLVRSAAEYSHLITAVSRYTRARALEWANVDPTRIRVLPNTVRVAFEQRAPSGSFLERHALGGRRLITTVSRISKADVHKGHARVVQALPEVLRRYPDALYVIAGDGNGQADIETFAERLRVREAIRLLGHIDDQDLSELYRASKVFIMPSTKEGFGIVFLEAAASGLPVIAGNVDGSCDALADGALGRLIDPLSSEQIVAAISDAFEGKIEPHPEEAKRFSFFNFSRHVDELVRSYF